MLNDPDASDIIFMTFDANLDTEQDFDAWNVKIDGNDPVDVSLNLPNVVAITMAEPYPVNATWIIGTPESVTFLDAAPLVAPFTGSVANP